MRRRGFAARRRHACMLTLVNGHSQSHGHGFGLRLGFPGGRGARGELFENLCRVTGKGCGVSPLRACDDRDQCESQDYHIHIV